MFLTIGRLHHDKKQIEGSGSKSITVHDDLPRHLRRKRWKDGADRGVPRRVATGFGEDRGYVLDLVGDAERFTELLSKLDAAHTGVPLGQ